MSMYDLPATLEYILSVTHQPSLQYVGHSQGTLIAFALLSHDQYWANKVTVGTSETSKNIFDQL